MALYYLPQYKTTTLAVPGGIDASQTTGIIVASIDGVDETKPGILCLSYADPINTATVEYVTYTSINASTKELQGVTRGAEGYSAHTHDNLSTCAWVVSKSHVNNINVLAQVEHNDDGTHKEASLDSMITGTEAQGDIIYHNGTIWTRLPRGTDGNVLTQASNVPSWAAAAAGLATDTLWDAAGDLVQGTGANTAAKLTIGSAGDILRVVSGAAAWTGANFKVGAFTRDVSAASGNVATTGVGFLPKVLVIMGVINAAPQMSIGFYDGTAHGCIAMYTNDAWTYTASYITFCQFGSGSSEQKASVASLDADGFTLTWTKTGTPTGTFAMYYLAFR